MYSPGGGNYRGGGGGRGPPDQWAGSRSPEDKRRYPSGPPHEAPFRERGPGALFPAVVDRDSRSRDQFDAEPPRKRIPQNPPFVGAGVLAPYEKAPLPLPPQDTPNDCEIIAVGNPASHYITMVENNIKAFSLKVDVMIPKQNVKISTFIENLAHRGTIFAVVIRPENENHKSVSVHVLRGPPKPEEHRNMPLQTAFSLIQKCYADLKKKEIGVIPESIKSLMRYIVDDRALTDNEYAAVIACLQDRRKRQAMFESRTPNDSGQAIYNADELQKKILSIFTGDPQAY